MPDKPTIKIPVPPEDAFITLDSGTRVEFDSGMLRDTTENKFKPQLALDGPLSFSNYFFGVDSEPEQHIWSLFFQWFRGADSWAGYDLITEITRREGGYAKYFRRCAELMTRGAAKYSDRNWMKAEGQAELDRFKESALRHFLQYLCGDKDEDHAAAVWFNINGALYVQEKLNAKG